MSRPMSASESRSSTLTRSQGWESKAGDAFFKQQRERADNCPAHGAAYFFGMMKNIARDMHRDTTAFACRNSRDSDGGILDLCAAPGGFLHVALRMNPRARAVGYTLPTAQGGHQILIPQQPHLTVREVDVTMLAHDIGVDSIPPTHPDSANFLPRQLPTARSFSLVICDGQVLRTHTRASWRERREATRLTLALRQVKADGTIIMLLHKVEAWRTVSLIYALSRIADIRLFKPSRSHAKRSSFYMVAMNVQVAQTAMDKLIEETNALWKVATFGTDEEYEAINRVDIAYVEGILHDYGRQLVELGTPIWAIQAEALSNARFNRIE